MHLEYLLYVCVCVKLHDIHYHFENICQWIFVNMDVLLSEIHKWIEFKTDFISM